MLIFNLLLFLVCLIILLKFSDYSVIHSSRLARALKFPEFIVSFFIIAFISVLPESTISIFSAFKGKPGLALGTLLGSNVTDLSLVFGIIALFSSSGIKVKSKIIENNFYYLILILLPLVLGINGYFSRIDGIILILAGGFFFYKMYKESRRFHKKFKNSKREPILKSLIILVISFAVIFISAYLTVKFAVNFSYDIKIPQVLVGITILAVGTCLPELIFSIKAIRKNKESLALGDLLGTVVMDATIILGIVALISPFKFNFFDLYLTGAFMFAAGVIVTAFMKSDKELSKNEGLILLFFYLIFVFAGLLLNKIIGL